IPYFQKAIDLEPHSPEAFAHLAMIRYERGETQLAVALVEQGVRANPDAFALLMTAGFVHRKVGRLREAEEEYQRASRVEPKRAEPLTELAALAEGRGDAEAARQFRERAQRLTTDSRGVPIAEQ